MSWRLRRNACVRERARYAVLVTRCQRRNACYAAYATPWLFAALLICHYLFAAFPNTVTYMQYYDAQTMRCVGRLRLITEIPRGTRRQSSHDRRCRCRGSRQVAVYTRRCSSIMLRALSFTPVRYYHLYARGCEERDVALFAQHCVERVDMSSRVAQRSRCSPTPER